MTASRKKGLRRELGAIVRLAQAQLSGSVPKVALQQRFVVFGPARSGSTLLVTLLNGHPDVWSMNEPLHDPTLFPIGLIERKFALMDTPYRGFKLLDEHLEDLMRPTQIAAMRDWIITQDVAIVHLQRENFLRQALSSFYAQARGGAWHSDRQNAQMKMQMNVDPKALIAWMDNIARRWDWRAEFLQGIRHHEVSYEADLATPAAQQATLDRVLGFLGLETVPAASDLRPVTPRSFESFVANWPQVQAELAKTSYAPMMENGAV